MKPIKIIGIAALSTGIFFSASNQSVAAGLQKPNCVIKYCQSSKCTSDAGYHDCSACLNKIDPNDSDMKILVLEEINTCAKEVLGYIKKAGPETMGPLEQPDIDPRAMKMKKD